MKATMFRATGPVGVCNGDGPRQCVLTGDQLNRIEMTFADDGPFAGLARVWEEILGIALHRLPTSARLAPSDYQLPRAQSEQLLRWGMNAAAAARKAQYSETEAAAAFGMEWVNIGPSVIPDS